MKLLELFENINEPNEVSAWITPKGKVIRGSVHTHYDTIKKLNPRLSDTSQAIEDGFIRTGFYKGFLESSMITADWSEKTTVKALRELINFISEYKDYVNHFSFDTHKDGEPLQNFTSAKRAVSYIINYIRSHLNKPLTEAKVFKLQVYRHGREFPIIVNPTPRELEAFIAKNFSLDLRGFTDKETGTTYWWEARQATHTDVAQNLAMVDDKDEHWHMFVREKGETFSMNLWHPFYNTKIAIKKNPYMKKISSDPLIGIEETITEAKVIKAHIYNAPHPVKVMVNPTSNDLLAFWSNLSAKSMRGITYKDGDSYWWDSYDATHSDLLTYLSDVLDKYSESHEWYLHSEDGKPTLRHAYDPVNTESHSKGYPSLRKMLRNPKIKVAYKGY